MAIVVCKQQRLVQIKNGFFDLKGFKEEIRGNVKIDELDVKAFNRTAETSGLLYEIDKPATKRRNESLKPKTEIKE